MAGNTNSGNRTMSNPYKAKSMENVDPEDNSRRIHHLIQLRKLPQIDYSDPNAIDDRFYEFLGICAENGMKPLITSFAVALGISRDELYKLGKDAVSGERLGFTYLSKSALKKALDTIEASYEDVLVNAKSGQVGQIFAMKNLGWRDQIEVTAPSQTSKSPRLSGADADEIARRYIEMAGADVMGYESLPALPPADAYEVPVAGKGE